MVTRRAGRRTRRSTGRKVKDCCRSFVAFVFSNVGIIALFLGYAILGAVVFPHIEGAQEQLRRYRMVGLRKQAADELWAITRRFNVMFEGNWTALVDERILQYQEQVVMAFNDGYEDKEEASLQWSFSGGFLYSLTVMTTIGYGNIAPRTPLGKITTVFYTCIGFPLFLLFLSNIGSVLAQSFKWLYAKLCRCQPTPVQLEVRVHYTTEPAGSGGGGSARLSSWTAEEEVAGELSRAEADEDCSEDSGSGSGESSQLDLSQITVPISMCLIIMAVYICGGGLFFGRLEGWDFLTSCYFCFISLSTIGFGDFVPGDSIRSDSGGVEIGFVLTSMYLMLGMAIIAMCFNLIQEEVIQKVRTCARCLGCLREDG